MFYENDIICCLSESYKVIIAQPVTHSQADGWPFQSFYVAWRAVFSVRMNNDATTFD